MAWLKLLLSEDRPALQSHLKGGHFSILIRLPVVRTKNPGWIPISKSLIRNNPSELIIMLKYVKVVVAGHSE